jgi:hypothetical protein
MEQPTQIGHRLRLEIDSKCEHILDVMTLRNIFEKDKIRYNELFKITQEYLSSSEKGKMGISKPTFNEHLNHLIKRKLICRKQAKKQKVYFYLNENSPEISNLRNIKDQMDKEKKLLIQISEQLEKEKTWENMPVFISEYFALCELRRTKLVFEQFFNPSEKTKANILSLAWQAKKQSTLEDLLINRIVGGISKIPDEEKRNIVASKFLVALNSAIREVSKALEVKQ